MSPHADIPDSPRSSAQWTKDHVDTVSETTSKPRSRLRQASKEDVQDLVCVGFGPASLAIAVALHDALEDEAAGKTVKSLKTNTPKITFLERQPKFAWHAGMQIPGAKMQISFVKDLATLRNPRSEFTFINYLHQNDRLVQFTNLGTFLPRRMEYEDYMRWCAGWFEEVVAYSEDVVSIEADKTSKGSNAVSTFTVTSRNNITRELSSRRAKNVVIAVGGRPSIPKHFPQQNPRVLHSSQYWTVSSKVFRDPTQPLKIAVIGSGQSAAEIFDNIPSRFPSAKVSLLIRGSALRPSDDSPFVNEVFNPERVDDYYSQDPDLRAGQINLDKATNYGVVRLELLEHIYSELYTNRIKYSSEEEWPQRILNHREVEQITELPDDRLRLHIRNSSSKYYKASSPPEETMDVDLVLVAAGYIRNLHEDMLQGVRHLMPGGDVEGQKWSVGRNYRVNFEKGAVADDAGVWLQGCNEQTHGVRIISSRLLKSCTDQIPS